MREWERVGGTYEVKINYYMFIVFEFDLESVTKHTVLLFMQHHSKFETHLLIVEFFITLIVFLHFKNILYVHDYNAGYSH